ncbi:MAG TPA: S9 family peptidase [Bacteroidales bacterium]|nr:S9 family peptidase [Bacteroidales bacterium]
MKKALCFFAIIMFVHSVAISQPFFTAELMWKLGRVSDPQVSPDGTNVLYGVMRYNLEENKGKRSLYTVPVKGGEALRTGEFSASVFNGIWRPDGKRIGFLKSDGEALQIWEMNPDGSNLQQLSNIRGGVTGFRYSPDMKNIFYTKQVKVEISPADLYPELPKTTALIYDDLMYRHWDSWHDYTYSHIFVTTYSKDTIMQGVNLMPRDPWDSPMEPFGGMEQIAWSPSGKQIAYTCKKMHGKEWTLSTNSDIYLFDMQTGKTTNLTEGMPGYDKDPVFSPDGKKIAWRSMATPGFEADKERIMVLDLKTGVIRDYSYGFDQSSSRFVWSADSRNLYFISGLHATFQIWSLSMYDASIRQITSGWHDYQWVAPAGDQLIGMKMSMSLPSELFRIDIEGNETQLTFTNRELLSNVELAGITQRWVETTDGKEMLVWVILPPDFDSTKKYPALLYCQGGPQSAVSQFFSYRWNFQMMAANGYVVVAPNRRGLPTFGQEWNDQISGDYGGQNMLDYLSAIDEVAKESWVDESRLGAVGASYGGFSVFWLAGHHQNRFRAFISHCGLFNLKSYYGSTEEYFFPNHDLGGPYWLDPPPRSFGFSPHLFVQNWDTPIMIIHGAHDYRVPYTESLQAFNAARLRGIPARLLFFPDETHFVLKPQNAVVWQNEFFRWFDQWLK